MSKFYKDILTRRYPYIIADIGMSHEGNVSIAKLLVDQLIQIKCDAVKFQSWTKDSLYARWARPKDIEELVLSPKDYNSLRKFCGNRIAFSSSASSFEEIDMFEKLKVPFFKVASTDLNNPVFLQYIAEKKKPIILSTGMGTISEVDRALNTIVRAGNDEIILLHCVSLYPPEDKDVNLRNIPMLRETFGFPVGFSDHTVGTASALASVALGALVIEKHYPSAWMKTIVESSKNIIDLLGSSHRILSVEELKQRKIMRRSIVTARAMRRGEYIHKEDIAFKRPGTGISPDEYKYVLGRRLMTPLKKDDKILWSDLV